MKLSKEEIERYSRQIVLRGVGGPGQNKLKAARALAIGAGGLGSPALQYLAGAGVGDFGDRRRRRRLALQSASPGAARDRQRRPQEGRQRRGGDRPPQSACRSGQDRAAARRGQRARARRRLGRRARRQRQFRHPLRRFRRLLLRRQAAGHRRDRRIRRRADDAEALRKRPRRQAQSDLPLPLSRGAAAGNRADLLPSRRARRARRRARLADGAGGDPRNRRRLRRRRPRPGRAAADDRHALDALRDADLRLGRDQSAERRRRAARLVNSR